MILLTSFDGHTELDNVNIAGVVTATTINATTFAGNGDFVDIDVDGHTNLDNVSVAELLQPLLEKLLVPQPTT